ncbi:MAG: hypothetical protein ACYDDA_15075, partial [Acidiferrobacteraceae bacterium]
EECEFSMNQETRCSRVAKHTSNSSSSSSLHLLQQIFPGQLFLSVKQAASVQNLAIKTVYNEISRGACPFKIIRRGRRTLIPIVGFAIYLDSLSSHSTPSGPGRPRGVGGAK